MSTNYTAQYGLFASLQLKVLRQINAKETYETVKEKAAVSDLEAFKFVYDLPAVKETIRLPSEALTGKNPSVAKSWRDKGNEAFARKCYKEALLMYNLCILNAPLVTDADADGGDGESSTELAFGFANRSAALHVLGLHEDAIKNIKWAFARKYPIKLRYKLCERQGRCLVALGRSTEANQAFQRALSLLGEAAVDDKLKEATKEKIKALFVSTDDNARQTTKQRKAEKQKQAKPDKFESIQYESEKYANLSRSCEIKSSKKKGLYIVATDVIQPGEVLIDERAYAWYVALDVKHTYCHHCMGRFTSPLPCPDCNVALFCNEECMVAGSAYHRYECPCLNVIMEDSIGTCTTNHLAFRIIAVTGLRTLLEHKKYLATKEADISDGALAYSIAYRWPTHTDNRSGRDLFERSLLAVFLLRCLERGGFFNDVDDLLETMSTTLDGVKEYVGGLLLRHLQSVAITGFGLDELRVPRGKPLEAATEVPMGGAVYPLTSLPSHSCNANTMQSRRKTAVKVRANSTIHPGEEITVSYGVSFENTSRSERHAWLKRKYNFTCVCQACVENWPTINLFQPKPPTHKCKSCKAALTSYLTANIKCRSCNATNNTTEMLSRLQRSELTCLEKGHSMLNNSYDAKGALPLLAVHVQLLEELVCQPFVRYWNCKEYMTECCRVLGNFHISD